MLIIWAILILLVLLLVLVIRVSDIQTAKRWDVFKDNNPELAEEMEKLL